MMLLNTEGRYLRITNSKGIEMVFHISLGKIYLLNCVETRTIEYWIGEQTSCHRELPVETNIDGKKIVGFINEQDIITQVADEIPCEIDSIISPTLISLSNYKRYQRRNRTVYSLDNDDKGKRADISMTEIALGDLNTHHAKAIISGFDELHELYNIQKVQLVDQEFYVKPIN